LYVLQMSKPRTFQELATKTHDIEVSHRGNSFYSTESKKDKVEFKKKVRFSKSVAKEVMFISTGDPIQITGKPKLEGKKNTLFKDATKKHPTLKESRKRSIRFLTRIYQVC